MFLQFWRGNKPPLTSVIPHPTPHRSFYTSLATIQSLKTTHGWPLHYQYESALKLCLPTVTHHPSFIIHPQLCQESFEAQNPDRLDTFPNSLDGWLPSDQMPYHWVEELRNHYIDYILLQWVSWAHPLTQIKSNIIVLLPPLRLWQLMDLMAESLAMLLPPPCGPSCSLENPAATSTGLYKKNIFSVSNEAPCTLRGSFDSS